MEFDLPTMKASDRYKVLVALVIPRPISLITTLNPRGVVNAAPFSFFNLLGDDPPVMVLSADARADGVIKDTPRNILEQKEFVVHLVDEGIAEKMHGTSVEAPMDVSELDLVGFTQAPSLKVKPPRIVEAPAAMECRLHTHIPMGTRHIILGEIVHLHVRDGIIDPVTLRRTEGDAYKALGRLYANRYCKLGEEISFDNSSYHDVMKQMGRA